MEPIAVIKDFNKLREELLTELHKAAGSFCRIGFLLKQARDTDVLKETSYSDVYDFASGEFDLDKTQVSRFININNRFSINGNSENLLPEYAEYGVAKLSLMLTLPDELNEELSPEYSKADIQAIKDEYDAEQKITPLEAMTEPPAEQPETDGDEFLALIVKELNEEHPEPLSIFHFEVRASAENLGLADKMNDPKTAEPDIRECYMPEGDSASYNIRISGQGRFMVAMKDAGITITNIRTLEKTPVTWQEFTEAVLEDETRREFKKPAEPEKQKAKKEKVHQSAIQKKAKEAREKYYEKPKREGKGLENNEKPAEVIEKVEGEVVDSEGQRIDNAPQNVPYPDGVEPEITHVSPEDPLPEEAEEAAGEEKTEEAPKNDNTAVSRGSAEAAGAERDSIQRLFGLLHGNELRRAVESSEMIIKQPNAKYRETLDEISAWVASLNNTVNKLYGFLHDREA